MKRVTIALLFSFIFIFVFVFVSALSVATTTTVTIGDIFSETNVTVPLMINDVVDVAAATIRVSYDPSVIVVTAVGNSDFESFTPNLWYADEGWVKMTGYNTVGGLSGDVKFAELTISPVGNYGDSTELRIEVETLSDSAGVPIEAEVKNGSFTVLSEEAYPFDTDSPENPYPSIHGIHNGTITPNKTIMVSRLYTYPCAGTGGHSEYIRIWNNSGWNRTATWNGYKDDRYNITFEQSFALQPEVEYYYTIITGSYPQIYHTDNLSTPAGFITCSEFIDANGKVYKDWIPAIRLSV